MASITHVITEAARRYGVDPAVMLRKAQIESRNDPNAVNPSGATGLFQFMPKTWEQYGRGADPRDAAANADAAARFTRDNMAGFRSRFGRDPTPAETYLMHQQGLGGASSLISNPDAPAASLVGRAAVVQNGGAPDTTARDFVAHWQKRFDGAPSVPPTPSAVPVAPPETPAEAPIAAADGLPAPGLDLSALFSSLAAQPAAKKPVIAAQALPSMRKKPSAEFITGVL